MDLSKEKSIHERRRKSCSATYPQSAQLCTSRWNLQRNRGVYRKRQVDLRRGTQYNEGGLRRKEHRLKFRRAHETIAMGGRKMNETLKVLETRRSCRNFVKDKMVPKEDIQAVVKAGTYAATGMGKQSPIIIAVTDKEVRDQLSAENAKIMGANTDPFYGAPVILIVLADKEIGTYKYDGSLVMGNLMNAAESLGLGSIWIHRAKEEFEGEFGKKLLEKLGIKGNYEGIGHCAIGYKAEPSKEAAPRKDNYVYYI